ncbi:MAG TPA: magnesium chelatase domain-containing protein, partial [Thermoleophilia bacterium]|nr:magnesium chelatase domain-containing protein [Thermoleophilia bacterium]
MLAKVHSCAVVGLEGAIVEVEVDTSRGLPSFTIVGLPDTAVQESRERVQAAIKNAGLSFPGGRLTVNLAPAALRKEGPAYDLPIALGTVAASGQLRPEWLEGALVVGELSLDGSVRHVRGILPMAALARGRATGEALKHVPLPAAGPGASLADPSQDPVACPRNRVAPDRRGAGRGLNGRANPPGSFSAKPAATSTPMGVGLP